MSTIIDNALEVNRSFVDGAPCACHRDSQPQTEAEGDRVALGIHTEEEEQPMSKPRKNRKSNKPSAAQQRLRELRVKARESGARFRLMKKALPDAVAAEEELREHVAKWAAALRLKISTLAAEVNNVLQAAKPGTVLGRVLDAARLSDVAVDLDEADCAACNLIVAGFDVPLPALLTMVKVVQNRHPLAAEGAKLFAEPSEPRS